MTSTPTPKPPSETPSPNTHAAQQIRALMAMPTPRRSQAELAEVLGISQQSVSRRLDGKQALTLDEVAHIAHWLEVSPQRLLIPTAA